MKKARWKGNVFETLTGHPAEQWREANSKRPAADREKIISENVARRLAGAEVTAIKSSDPADPSIPVAIQYHVKVQGYATRTGKRLFFAPAYFEVNEPTRYAASVRKYDLLFKYPWSELEDISITPPANYELDHADAPVPLSFGAIGGYDVKILKMPGRIYYHRELTFGKDGTLSFPNKGYPLLKQAFDSIHDRDAHMLSLKLQQTAASAGPGQ